MKKIFLLSSFSLIALSTFAQTVPNSGFETWVTNTESPRNYLLPQSWMSFDPLINSFNNTYTVTSLSRTSSSHTGSFAALMQTVIGGGDTTAGALLSTGTIASFFGNQLQGVPFSSRPAFLQGYYKFTGISGDGCYIGAKLTKWNTINNRRDTIANIVFINNSNVSAYTQFSIPITYLYNEFPDTISFFATLSFSPPAKKSHVGTMFYLDDIGFSGSVPFGIEQFIENDNNIRVYPNPAQEVVNFEYNHLSKITSIKIIDELGKEVKTFNLNISASVIQVDISDLPNGVYQVILTSESASDSKKFIIKR